MVCQVCRPSPLIHFNELSNNAGIGRTSSRGYAIVISDCAAQEWEGQIIKRLWMAIVLLLGLLPHAVVSAHSPVVERIPDANAVVESAPARVELVFRNAVQLHGKSVVVRDGNKNEVQAGKAQADPANKRRVGVELLPDLAPGTYTVIVDVISSDGHPIQESYRFVIKETPGPEPEPEPTPEERFERLDLLRTAPADGSIVEASPGRIELWFNEPAELPLFAVLDDKQQLMPVGTPQADPVDPRHFVLELPEELAPGTYAMYAYPKIGEDSKIFTVYFAVGELTSITGENSFPGKTLADQAGWSEAAHWLSYFSLLPLAGGTWFVNRVARGGGRMNRWRAAANGLFALGLLAALLEIAAYRSAYPSVAFGDFIQFNPVRISLLQAFFLAAGWAIAGARLPFLLAAVACWTFVGHSADPTYGIYPTVALDALHLYSVALWMGGLAALLALLPAGNAVQWLKEKGRAFSGWALGSFAVTGVTGVLMTLEYVPAFSLESLIESFWGQMLALKAALFLLVLVFGIRQRRLLGRMTDAMASAFGRNGKIELLIGAVILAAAAMLVDFSPGEAVQRVSPKTQEAGGMIVNVDVAPIKPGANDITFRLSGDSDVAKVIVTVESDHHGTARNNAFSLGGGIYKLTGNVFYAAGEYRVSAEVVKKNGETVAFPPHTVTVPGVMQTHGED